MSAAEVRSPLKPVPKLRVVPLRKTPNHLVNHGLAGGLLNGLSAVFMVHIAHCDVLSHRGLIPHWLLKQRRDLALQVLEAIVSGVDPIDQGAALLDIVQTPKEFGEGRLHS